MVSHPAILRSAAAALLVSLFTLTPADAAGPKPASALERLPEPPQRWVLQGSMRVSLATGAPVALYRVDAAVIPAAPEVMARQYLAEHTSLLRLRSPELDDLELRGVWETLAGVTVRFRQLAAGVPVYGPDLAVTINHDAKVVFVASGYEPRAHLAGAEPTLPAAAARQAALEYLGLTGPLYLDRSDLVAYPLGSTTRLAHRVLLGALGTPAGEWEVLVDAHTGEILRAEDKALYATGSGRVFLPDPLSSAGAAYGDPGFVDDGDANNAQLNEERFNVALLGITDTAGTFTLVGPWAEITDWDTPFKGLFPQMSSIFNFNRSLDGFEAVNTYYHIDTFMRYMNTTLGVPVHPYQYAGGVQFDPHGFSGADNSSYSSGSGRLRFGEGGVDDAEDADVIIHELGHGIHDWVTMGGLSQNEGLSEGVGDYFAASYSRSFGQWTPADPEYQWVFSWDGHNPFWGGRVTNWTDTRTYPQDLVGQIHTDGQFWSSCNMQIWDAVGRETIDRAMLVGLGMTNGGSNQLDAAQAVLQAAADLGTSGADLAAMEAIYQGCGYTVTLPTLIFSDGFESGNTSAWTSTMP